ncbi:MAG: lycopene cyclase domain-containing protein [Taibaiella sp.]|nr:lycopene cyclase domain-containing protein [Taibaiella sp.]
MRDNFTYLAVDLGCIVFPFLFSFHPRSNFIKEWRNFLVPCLVVGAFFILWDAVFTYMGVWQFNPRYVLGYYVLGLPVEELLFFVCIPYACTFTYYCMTRYFRFTGYPKAVAVCSYLLALSLFVIAVIHASRLYTSVTFSLLALLLVWCTRAGYKFIAAFYVTFAFILIPFFISNGILTGTGLPEPVVIYNNAHNLGIRMLTIPFEDTFYGMLLLLLNVVGYELMKKREVNNSQF